MERRLIQDFIAMLVARVANRARTKNLKKYPSMPLFPKIGMCQAFLALAVQPMVKGAMLV